MEADKIFDAFDKLSKIAYLTSEKRKKHKEIYDLKSKVCGNCDHWMKSTCEPEKKHKEFKSCGSIACKDFIVKDWVTEMASKRELELAEIDNKLSFYK